MLSLFSSRRRVYDFARAPNTRVVHTDTYRPFAFDRPDSPQNVSAYCPHLLRPGPRHDNRDWRFCTGERAGRMHMHVVRQLDAMFDRGFHHMGATFDRWHIYLMSHPNSEPALHLRKVARYAELAQALEPYAGEAQSHFWFGTVQHVLTLYDVLPARVPIVVAHSPALEPLYAMLDVNRSRLVRFDRSTAYSASVLYSIMLQPWSRDEQGGEPVSPQSVARLRAHLPLAPPAWSGGSGVVLVSRRDRAARRCRNHEALLAPLSELAARQGMWFLEFAGSDMSTARARDLFKGVALVVAPHGGALLNLAFMPPGAAVVEIGYHEADATRYRSMRFPPWYFVMAKLFGLRYALVMAPGAYDAPIECPVDEVVRCATQILTV